MNRLPLLFAAAFATVCGPVFANPPFAAKKATAKKTAFDPAALALLKKSETAMAALKTYQADCLETVTYDRKPGDTQKPFTTYTAASIVAARPNQIRYDLCPFDQMPSAKNAATAPAWRQSRVTYVCDGELLWQHFGNMYRRSEEADPKNFITTLDTWNGFWLKSNSPYGKTLGYQKKNELLEARKSGQALVNGVVCDKVFTHIKRKYQVHTLMEEKTTWFIGTKDGLVRRETIHVNIIDIGSYHSNIEPLTLDIVIRNIRTNFTIANPAKTFTYVPPKGVVSEAELSSRPRPEFLANGTLAPNFTAYDKNGKAVKLSDFKGKVILLDFWASWCAPCVGSMPHNQSVAQKLQKAGLPFVMLAIDNGEPRPYFLRWVNKQGTRLNAIRFVHADPEKSLISERYHVFGLPSQYLVDTKGVVRASSVAEISQLEQKVRAALQ